MDDRNRQNSSTLDDVPFDDFFFVSQFQVGIQRSTQRSSRMDEGNTRWLMCEYIVPGWTLRSIGHHSNLQPVSVVA